MPADQELQAVTGCRINKDTDLAVTAAKFEVGPNTVFMLGVASAEWNDSVCHERMSKFRSNMLRRTIRNARQPEIIRRTGRLGAAHSGRSPGQPRCTADFQKQTSFTRAAEVIRSVLSRSVVPARRATMARATRSTSPIVSIHPGFLPAAMPRAWRVAPLIVSFRNSVCRAARATEFANAEFSCPFHYLRWFRVRI